MAKISLRAYNHEIENLIDRGQTEEGITHCKYILKTYSKHLDTYRLLGKAFLESQRYSEAADILQRILSVQPDDFVSQIGMSIIREDEGNLDAAIYHMERAFEIQPANVAIQDELRRLYGRRDGVEPSKLRMTRGALVRMYARGELYRQAIAEVRAALKEDPQRLDLEIVLARMYFQTGLKAEAAEISSRLVGKLPYCYEANRILAEVLPETSRAEEAKNYQQKLTALDPYLAYLSGTVIDPRQVPENAVSLDRLDWTPSIDSNQQPAWANSLGINLNETENEKMPQWMSAVPTGSNATAPVFDGEETSQPFTEEPALFESQIDAISPPDETQITSQDNELPDWMKSSGWGISSQPAQEQSDIMLESEDLAAEPANIPDWLKEIAPDSDTELPQEAASQNADWINTLLPAESAAEAPIEQSHTEFPALEDNPIPPESTPSIQANDELPDWFKASMPSTDDAILTNQSNEPLPEWLTETPQTPAETINEETQNSVALVIPVEEITELPTVDTSSEIEQTYAESAPPVEVRAPQELSENPPDLTNVDDAMAWLESLAAKNGAEEATLLTTPEERIDTPPEWVSQAAAEPPSSIAIEPQINIPAEEVLAETPFLGPLAIPAAEETIEPVDQTLTPEPVDMDTAFSWLESLAAKQGANAESLLSAADDRQENPPDWVQTQAAEAAIQSEPVSAVEPESTIEQPPQWIQSSEDVPVATETIQAEEQSIPDWLNSIDSSSEQPFTHSEEQAVITNVAPIIEEWIQEQDTQVIEFVPDQNAGQTQTIEASKENPADVELPATFGKTRPLPSWLVSDSGTAPNIEPTVSQPESIEELPLPDWLKEETQPVYMQASSIETPTAEDAPDLPDWLKNLEAEQEEETLPVSTIPSQISEPPAVPVMISHVPSEMLAQAQEALTKGQIDLSMSIYSQLIQQGQHVEETIHDLRDALYRYPVESEIWQTLGDANFRNNHVQDALDAYTKAEELLR